MDEILLLHASKNNACPFVLPFYMTLTYYLYCAKLLEINIEANKITSLPRKTTVHEVSTSPMLFDSDTEKTVRRKIIIIKKHPDDYESPSIMIRPDLIQQYENSFNSKNKKKCPLAFLELPLPFNRTINRSETNRIDSQRHNKIKIRSHRLLKRHFSDNNSGKNKTQRMFDYNEILNITCGKLNLK